MDHNVTIGAKVKAFRTAKKYTLKQLSEESGLSIGFLSQLERGLSSIAIDSLAKLADILGVSLAAFFDSNSEPEKSPVNRSFSDKSPDYSISRKWKCAELCMPSPHIPSDALRPYKQ